MNVLAFALLLSALPLPLFAQTLGGPSGQSFSISVDPQYPLPNTSATVSFLSSSLDLANATIEVTVNGKEAYAGTVHSVSIPLGRAGSTSTVTATVSYQGSSYSQTAVLQPQDVVLVPEPAASAPALYPGKPGVPLSGSVRVVAMAGFKTASGASVSPASLSYSWMVDDTQIANSSGIGKHALIVASPLEYRSRNVSVTVTNADGSLTGGASLALTANTPVVRIYENDPLLGIRFERALSGTFGMNGAESSLFAAPFSLPTASGNPLVAWFLNGAAAQSGTSITLRPTGSGEGQASLSVVASSGDAKATNALTLSFGQSSAPSFFGL